MFAIQQLSAPIGRFLLSLIFVMSGVNKLGEFEATQGYMDAMGVPGILLPIVIITEIVGGIAIILGWKTKIAAFGLAGFTFLSAVLFHADFSNTTDIISFMKNLAITGAFLLLVAQGAGAYSLDNRATRHIKKQEAQ
ncbi:DoxX family protein [Shewanella maritima]|uniref:DoxX family protein n=1 Tax=Shewanella maritima TaxID=2520507 RepID=UPI003735B6E4